MLICISYKKDVLLAVARRSSQPLLVFSKVKTQTMEKNRNCWMSSNLSMITWKKMWDSSALLCHYF